MASRRPDPLAPVDRVLAPLTWVVAAFAVVVLLVGPQLIGADKGDAEESDAPAASPTATATATATATGGRKVSGSAVFESAGCGDCHALAAAGASGAVGPNLDDLRPSAAAVETVVTNGRGTMPSFRGELSSAEIRAVARYVAGSAGQ
jgi:mono/diheme cytochrome c family protein